MGIWADTFGGGNSFKESVANTFTKGDGASYVGGTLQYDKDGGVGGGGVVKQNEDGTYGTSTGLILKPQPKWYSGKRHLV